MIHKGSAPSEGGLLVSTGYSCSPLPAEWARLEFDDNDHTTGRPHERARRGTPRC